MCFTCSQNTIQSCKCFTCSQMNITVVNNQSVLVVHKNVGRQNNYFCNCLTFKGIFSNKIKTGLSSIRKNIIFFIFYLFEIIH